MQGTSPNGTDPWYEYLRLRNPLEPAGAGRPWTPPALGVQMGSGTTLQFPAPNYSPWPGYSYIRYLWPGTKNRRKSFWPSPRSWLSNDTCPRQAPPETALFFILHKRRNLMRQRSPQPEVLAILRMLKKAFLLLFRCWDDKRRHPQRGHSDRDCSSAQSGLGWGTEDHSVLQWKRLFVEELAQTAGALGV